MAKLKAPLPRLTDRNKEVLKYILSFYRRELAYPSKSQIGRHFGASSSNTSALVAPLMNKGDLRALPERGQYEISSQGFERLTAMGLTIPEELVVDDAEQQTLELTS